jgi:hypothetical protein
MHGLAVVARPPSPTVCAAVHSSGKKPMNSIIYIIGLIVVVLIILSFFGLR